MDDNGPPQISTQSSSDSPDSTASVSCPVLAAILFLIYINDLTQNITNGECNIFADGVRIYTSGETLSEVNTKLQMAVSQADKWYQENKLNVNAGKCDTLLIASHHHQSNHSLNINIGGSTINQSSSVKYLGITVNNTLNWSTHILNICTKIRPIISMINRMRKWMPAPVLQTIYSTYVQPHFDYGITIWGNSPDTHLYQLQRQQHFMARIITNNFDFINYRGNHMLYELGLYNIKQRYAYPLSCPTFKCLHHLAHIVTELVLNMLFKR